MVIIMGKSHAIQLKQAGFCSMSVEGGGSDFSCQKLHKVGSGLKLAGAGVVAGTAALIAAPVIAAKEDGVTGFFKGLATGVCGAVGLTLGGVVAGATQVARGLVVSGSRMIEKAMQKHEFRLDLRSFLSSVFKILGGIGET